MAKFELVEPEEKIGRDSKPYVTFPLLNSCTLKCKYCGDGGEMSISEIQKANIDDLFEWHKEARLLGVEKFRLTGGEPLIHPDFTKIVNTIAKDASIVLVNTNGTLLKKYKEKWIDAPMNCQFVVNYHGADEETYDKITGTKGYYNIVKEGIELLASEGRLHRLNIVLCKDNYDQIFDVIAYCKKLGCDLKIQDVVAVPWQFNIWDEIYFNTTEIEKEFENRASFVKDHKYAKSFGTPSKIYTIDGVNVTLKSVRNGSHYDMENVCKGCDFFPCHEGVYDLFVFPDNTAFACNWTQKSKAPYNNKKEQLEWLIEVFQRSRYIEASDRIKNMLTGSML
jgi:molybdenum cofactor biosynthesis enzyme MoaA